MFSVVSKGQQKSIESFVEKHLCRWSVVKFTKKMNNKWTFNYKTEKTVHVEKSYKEKNLHGEKSEEPASKNQLI